MCVYISKTLCSSSSSDNNNNNNNNNLGFWDTNESPNLGLTIRPRDSQQKKKKKKENLTTG